MKNCFTFRKYEESRAALYISTKTFFDSSRYLSRLRIKEEQFAKSDNPAKNVFQES